MNHEQIMTQINEGSTANVCLQWMEPIFEQVSNTIVENLKHKVRNGESSELLLASGVASLIAIDDLKAKLQSIARNGNAVRKRLEDKDE